MKIRKYTFKIFKNWSDLIWWRNIFLYYILSPLLFKKNNSFYIFSEPWDNLIILDACRYDVFEEVFKKRNMKGKLEYRISRGSWTVEFLLENFGDEKNIMI